VPLIPPLRRIRPNASCNLAKRSVDRKDRSGSAPTRPAPRLPPLHDDARRCVCRSRLDTRTQSTWYVVAVSEESQLCEREPGGGR
jgi:hypothetical protein